MTNKQAIEIIKVAIEEVKWDYPLDYVVAFEKAIEILRKATPEEPVCVFDIEDEPVCPYCRQPLDMYDEHCNICDQRIDWQDW